MLVDGLENEDEVTQKRIHTFFPNCLQNLTTLRDHSGLLLIITLYSQSLLLRFVNTVTLPTTSQAKQETQAVR